MAEHVLCVGIALIIKRTAEDCKMEKENGDRTGKRGKKVV